MTLTDWANIAVIVPGAVVPLSLFLLLWQLRRQEKLTRAANAQSLVEITSPFNLALIQDPEMAELWRTGGERYPKMDVREATRYTNLLTWWLLLHENIYHQRNENLIDDAIYNSWQRELSHFVAKHRLAERWPSMKEFYREAFADHVNRLIQVQELERRRRAACKQRLEDKGTLRTNAGYCRHRVFRSLCGFVQRLGREGDRVAGAAFATAETACGANLPLLRSSARRFAPRPGRPPMGWERVYLRRAFHRPTYARCGRLPTQGTEAPRHRSGR